MDKQGLTDDKLMQILNEGLNATKVVGYLNNKVNGTQKVSDEFVEIPDYATRHRYLETLVKLKGLNTQKVEHSGKVEGGDQKIVIIRADKEAKSENKTKTFSRQVSL